MDAIVEMTLSLYLFSFLFLPFFGLVLISIYRNYRLETYRKKTNRLTLLRISQGRGIED